MRIRRTSFWLLISTLGVAITFTSPGAFADERAQAVLEEMGDAIAALSAFAVDGELYSDARLPEGLVVTHAAEVSLRVIRPGAMRLIHASTEETKEIYFTDGTFTVMTQPRNFYAQTDIPEAIEAAAAFALDELDADIPLIDLIMKDVAAHLSTDGELEYLGTSLIRGEEHHQLVIRGPEVDVQLWINVEGVPLPRMISISEKWEGGAPRSVGFLNWDTDPDIPEGSLAFEPPDNAVRIKLMRDLEAEEAGR